MKTPVTVHVGQTVVIDRVELRQANPAIEVALQQRVTFANPAWKPGSKTEPEKLVEVSTVGDGRYLRFQRGSVRVIKSVMALYQQPVTWETSRVVSRPTGPQVDPAMVDDGLRDYQLEAARALLAAVQGVVSIPTGGGKTRTVSAAVLASSEPAIVFCHTDDIFQQWTLRFLQMGVRPRRVSGGRSDFRPLRAGEVAVASIQTIDRNFERAKPLLESAGCVAFDEVHHLPAGSWRRIAEACPARLRWGCTATVDRDDGLQVLLAVLVGPVVYEVRELDLIERGFLSAPRIVPVATGWGPDLSHYMAIAECPYCERRYRTSVRRIQAGDVSCGNKRCDVRPVLTAQDIEIGKLDYSYSQSQAMLRPEVLDGACRLVEVGVDAGRTVLVLLPRRDAVEEVTRRLCARGIAAVGVTGSDGKGGRRTALRWVRRGDRQALVATTLADEGLDVPNIDMIVNIMSGKASGKARQRTGRALRPVGEDPLIFELVHDGVPYERQWEKRRAAYARVFGKGAIYRTKPISWDAATKILTSETDRKLRDAAGF